LAWVRAWLSWMRSPLYCSSSWLIWFDSTRALAIRVLRSGAGCLGAAELRPLGRTKLARAAAPARVAVCRQRRPYRLG